MLGYFSGFKEVFFVLLVAGTGVLAGGRRNLAPLLATGAGLLLLAVVWQAIKGPYRMFLSQGERAQIVTVSVPERISWLVAHAGEIDSESLDEGLEDGLRRLGYVDFFAQSLRNVPAMIPHTHGLLWKEAVLHPLMPRLFFPNKPAINDSDRTNTYTGVTVAGADEGTSISIGYVGESYIDFGKYGMFVPILLWGWLIGWCHEFLIRRAPHMVMGSALGACLLLSTVLQLESSNIKMMGSLMAGFLVTAVLLHFWGKQAWGWIAADSELGRARTTGHMRHSRSPR